MLVSVQEVPISEIIRGELFYREDEYSLDFVVEDAKHSWYPGTSLLIGTLSLEIDPATGRILYPWGLHPFLSWTEAAIQPPKCSPGQLFVGMRGDFKSGVSAQLSAVGEWGTVFDRESGWLVVNPSEVSENQQFVQICDQVIIGFSSHSILSVWLNPAWV